MASVSGQASETLWTPKVVFPTVPLTPAQAACRGQRESSYFRGSHAAAFCSRGAEVPENTRLGLLIGGTVGLGRKTRVGEYKKAVFHSLEKSRKHAKKLSLMFIHSCNFRNKGLIQLTFIDHDLFIRNLGPPP